MVAPAQLVAPGTVGVLASAPLWAQKMAERRALLREVDEWRQQAAQDAQAAKQQRAQLREKDQLLGEVEVKLGKFVDSEARLREALREKVDALNEARAQLDAADAAVARLREEAEQKDDALEAIGAKLRALGQEVVLARRSAEEVAQRKCVSACVAMCRACVVVRSELRGSAVAVEGAFRSSARHQTARHRTRTRSRKAFPSPLLAVR